MRGIAGIIRFDGPPPPPDEIERVIRHMAVGPVDELSTWTEGRAALAYLLRGTTEEDDYEVQPLHDPAGTATLVTDALLDNRDELLVELGWTPAQALHQPDSALVLAAWRRWGEACPLHLEGRFALAIWQPQKAELFCALGRVGGALFFTETPGRFAFATTLRGLFCLPDVSRELSEPALAEHLVRIPHEPFGTIYRQVRKLEAGTALRVNAHGLQTFVYWEPSLPTELRLKSDDDYLAAFRHELTTAVARRLRAKGNIGCRLSGGLDSSAVTAIAGKLLAEKGRRLHALHTLPATPTGRYQWQGRELDESTYVRALEKISPHIDFHYLPADIDLLPLGEWDRLFEIHHVPLPSLPARGQTRFWQCLTEHDIGQVLTGVGGNTIVSMESRSWNYHGWLAKEGRWLRLAREMWGQHRVYGTPLRTLLRNARRGQTARFDPEPHLRFLSPAFRRRTDIDQRFEAAWRGPLIVDDPRQSLLNSYRTVSIRNRGTPNANLDGSPLLHTDQPLFDRRLTEFALSLPFEQQIRAGWDRRLMRLALPHLLPSCIRWRTTRGLPQPEFQFRFKQFLASTSSAQNTLSTLDAARAYLDLSWMETMRDSPSARDSWSYELLTINAFMIERFLNWKSSS